MAGKAPLKRLTRKGDILAEGKASSGDKVSLDVGDELRGVLAGCRAAKTRFGERAVITIEKASLREKGKKPKAMEAAALFVSLHYTEALAGCEGTVVSITRRAKREGVTVRSV